MRNAQGRHAWLSLGGVAFAESSFFPIPPDVMLIPMALADRKRALLMAAWCTLMSVIGGAFGYAIGAFLYDSVGHWLISLYGYQDKLEMFREVYAHWGIWIVLIAGVTPIPYKLITIASGFALYNFGLFMLFSAVARGARFFVVAGLLYAFGEPIRAFIERWLEWITIGLFVLLVLGIAVVRYAF
ncbi:MAG: DedA family protein [Alphaproteobacteria bacterium]|nr:DedA family protein [Alphaproteobacteria bacterium]